MYPALFLAIKFSYTVCDTPEALSRLGDDITQMSAHLDAGTFQLLKLIGEFDEKGGWHGIGIHSCAHWLNWKCGISLGPAREKVRVARALPGLPKISKAFRAGKVSYSKVRAMTRVATEKNEEALLQVALGGTASHVETQVRLYRKTKRIEALQEENLRHAHRALSWYVDEDGSWIFKGRPLDRDIPVERLAWATSWRFNQLTKATGWKLLIRQPFQSGMATGWILRWRWIC